ncbi:hypothetical protein D3C75_1348400 [compost metagenome]
MYDGAAGIVPDDQGFILAGFEPDIPRFRNMLPDLHHGKQFSQSYPALLKRGHRPVGDRNICAACST